MNTIKDDLCELEKLKRQKRYRERQEREAQKKEDNHWNFVAGSLVAKYLKADLNIPVYKGEGATRKNKEAFMPLENILAYLASHKELMAQIIKECNRPPSDTP